MKNKILRFFLFSTFTLLFTQVNAVITTRDCNKHASDVMIMASEITHLSDEQYILLNSSIMKSYLNNIIKTDSDTIENEENKDWFTEKILSGSISKKDGNKRLKKLK